MITHDTPDSSHIARLQYDETSSQLIIEFRNGKKYSYSDVPYEIWNDFIESPSAGKYFSANIRGKYQEKNITV